MKSYLRILCLLMVAIALILGNCSKKKSTQTDTQSPSVTITAPTSGATYATNQSTVDLGGTASDDEGVTSVTWANLSISTGASGNCTGTTSWSVSGITLQAQDNLIVITASDAENNTGKDSLTVTYTTEPEGTIKWQWETDSDVCICNTPAIGPDGNIYVTGGGGTVTWVPAKLFCVSPQGSMLWKSQDLDHNCASDPVIGLDGTIYVVGYYTLYAFNPNGALRWEWEADPHYQIGGLALGTDGTIYTAHITTAYYVRRVFAINPDGSLRWSNENAWPSYMPLGPNTIRALTIGKNGEVYANCQDYGTTPRERLRALNPDNGSILWDMELGVYVNQGGMAIGSDGTIYVPLAGGTPKLAAITPDGAIKWEYDMATPGIPSIGSDGTVYVTGSKLYALTSSGQVKWTASDGSAGAPEVAIASDGTIYSRLFHSEKEEHLLTAVNPDGSIKWTLEIPFEAGTPAIGSDGTIYVTGGCRPGVLTAVYGSAPLASSPWPRSRCGNRNTGCYGEY